MIFGGNASWNLVLTSGAGGPYRSAGLLRGRFQWPAHLACGLVCLTLLVVPVIGRQRPTPAATRKQAIEARIEAHIDAKDFLTISPPIKSFEVGGLIIPGNEQSGTRHHEALLRLFENPQIKEQSIPLDFAIDLGTFDDLDDRIPALKGALAASNQCLKSRLLVKELIVKGFINGAESLKSPVPFSKVVADTLNLTRRAGQNNVKEDDVKDYVIVTATVAPAVTVKGCSIEHSGQIERAIKALTWGYRAAKGGRSGASYDPSGRSLYDIVEERVSALVRRISAPDRTVVVGQVRTEPNVVGVFYIGPVQLDGRNAYIIPNQAYTGPAFTPISSLRLYAGRFYFRLKYRDGNQETIWRDITPNMAGDTLVLRPIH